MSLAETAKELFVAGWTTERVRAELRGTVLSCGDMPTCGAVEEAISEARLSARPALSAPIPSDKKRGLL